MERMGKRRGAYWVSWGKYEGMRLFGKPSCRWEDNIKVYLKEIGWERVDGLIWLRTGTGGGLL